ncbi:MAG: hypothetical protein IKR49_00340, partial [Clostridia bacterium]|nr:hypothetical protein [Clostridia bacterium]
CNASFYHLGVIISYHQTKVLTIPPFGGIILIVPSFDGAFVLLPLAAFGAVFGASFLLFGSAGAERRA